MKGILHKGDNGWVVKYKMDSDLIATDGGYIPLHQDNFDINTKQPIIVLKEGKEVKFEMKKVFLSDQTLIYARLIPTKEEKKYNIHDYPELEGTTNLCNDIIKQRSEISDEEIDKQAELIEQGIHRMFFKTGAKWYREQIKLKKYYLMATLESQYKSYLIENPDCGYSFDEWMEKVMKPFINNAVEQIEKIQEKKDLDKK